MYARIEKPESLSLEMPADWLTALAKLVRVLKRDEYPTADALLSDLVGNNVAAMVMLRRLLLWHRANSGRAIFMSETDWWNQDRLKRGVIQRAKAALRDAGWVMEVRKARGVPTTHYRLDAWQMAKRVAALVKMPVVFLVSILRGNGSAQNRQMGLPGSSRSLTKSHSNDSSKQTVVGDDSPLSENAQLLVAAGLGADVARGFEDLPRAVVVECIEASRRPTVKNAAGYLAGALRRQADQRRAAALLLEEVPGAQDAIPPLAPPAAQGEESTSGDKTGMTGHAPTGDDVYLCKPVAWVMAGHAPTGEDAWVWGAAYNQLELQMDRQSFDLLRGAKLVGVDGGVFVVRVESDYARQMLQHRLYRTVQRVLRDCRGEQTDVRFEVM